jgi:enoyl-CoA hydratase/carnithine racemase
MADASSFADMVSREAELQNVCIASDDAREGVMAFLEKREAQFTGR